MLQVMWIYIIQYVDLQQSCSDGMPPLFDKVSFRLLHVCSISDGDGGPEDSNGWVGGDEESDKECDDNDSELTSPCSPMSGWQLKCLSLTEEYIFVRVQDAVWWQTTLTDRHDLHSPDLSLGAGGPN